MNWPQVSQFSQLKPRRFFHGHVCPNSTPWRLTRMIRRRCRVREKLLWLSCSGWFFLLGNHGVSGWTSWKRRVFNCETSVQAVDWAMNHQETTGKPTFFDHEWGNQELIFFSWHLDMGSLFENRSQQWPSHPRGLIFLDSSRLPFPNLLLVVVFPDINGLSSHDITSSIYHQIKT